MISQFAQERIFPNVQNIEKLDEDLSRAIMREMGELGLIGADAPEEFGGAGLDKITACLITEGVGWGGSSSFGCTFGVQTGIGSLGIVFLELQSKKKNIYQNLCQVNGLLLMDSRSPLLGQMPFQRKPLLF